MRVDKYINIGKALKQVRLENNLTQRDFAKCLGIKTSTYSNYEKNLRTPSIEFLSNVEKEFDIELSINVDSFGLKRKPKSKEDVVKTILLDMYPTKSIDVNALSEEDINYLYSNIEYTVKFFINIKNNTESKGTTNG